MKNSAIDDSATASFSFWQMRLEDIYREQNSRMRPLDLTTCLTRRAQTLCKIQVKPEFETQMKLHAGMVFGFISAVASYFKINLAEVLWYHFPGVCSTCAGQKCACAGQPKPARRPNTHIQRVTNVPPTNINGFQQMFAEIYHQNDLVGSCAHLAEEAGEVGECVSRMGRGEVFPGFYEGDIAFRASQDLELEIADAIAHWFAVVTLMNEPASDLLDYVFGDGCPVCRKTFCDCGGDFELTSVGTVVAQHRPHTQLPLDLAS